MNAIKIKKQIVEIKGEEFKCQLPKWVNRKDTRLTYATKHLILLHPAMTPHKYDEKKKSWVEMDANDPFVKRQDKKDEKEKEETKVKKVTKKKRKDVETSKDTEIIKGNYYFTDEEKTKMANELAQKQIDKEIVDNEKKSIVSGYADRLKRFDFEIKKLSRNIIDGHELRDFDCHVQKHYKKHIKFYIDKHTKREIDNRPLDPSDYQQEMDL